jgi:hypothetical protein
VIHAAGDVVAAAAGVVVVMIAAGGGGDLFPVRHPVRTNSKTCESSEETERKDMTESGSMAKQRRETQTLRG